VYVVLRRIQITDDRVLQHAFYLIGVDTPALR